MWSCQLARVVLTYATRFMLTILDNYENEQISAQIVRARKPRAFWWENVVATVSLPKVSAKMPQWQKKVSKF